jgi:hypothetical protein
MLKVTNKFTSLCNILLEDISVRRRPHRRLFCSSPSDLNIAPYLPTFSLSLRFALNQSIIHFSCLSCVLTNTISVRVIKSAVEPAANPLFHHPISPHWTVATTNNFAHSFICDRVSYSKYSRSFYCTGFVQNKNSSF